MADNSLRGRRIALVATDGFEQSELMVPMKALTESGAEVDIISLRRGSIRGMTFFEPAGRVRVTKTVEEANPADYDGIFIPGGFVNPDLLRQSARVREFVRAFDAAGKPIASICHGPWVLISAGLARGRTLTSWPGIRDDVVNAGATWVDQELVRDGNIMTSRSPQDLPAFARGIREFYREPALARAARQRETQSAPQPARPPQLPVGGIHWLPRPSVPTAAVLLGAVGLGIAAATRRRAESHRYAVPV